VHTTAIPDSRATLRQRVAVVKDGQRRSKMVKGGPQRSRDREKTAAPREHGDDVAGGHVVQPRGGLVEEQQRGRLVTDSKCADACSRPIQLHQLGRERDETCPVSTGGGTRRVQLVRRGSPQDAVVC